MTQFVMRYDTKRLDFGMYDAILYKGEVFLKDGLSLKEDVIRRIAVLLDNTSPRVYYDSTKGILEIGSYGIKSRSYIDFVQTMDKTNYLVAILSQHCKTGMGWIEFMSEISNG